MASRQLQPTRFEIISPFLQRQGEPWTVITHRVWTDLVDRGLTGVPLPTKPFGQCMKKIKGIWENNIKVISRFSEEGLVQLPFTPFQLGFATPKRKRSHSEPNISITSLTFNDDGDGTGDGNGDSDGDGDGDGDESFAVPFSPVVTPHETTKKLKPRKMFHDSGKKSKKRKTEDMFQHMVNYPLEEVVFSFKRYLKLHNISSAVDIVEVVLKDEKKADLILKKINAPPIRFTDTHALALKNDLDLSIRQYRGLQLHLETLDMKEALPSRVRIQAEQKKCYPDGIIVTNNSAEVPLQNLLNKSVERLLESLGEKVLELDSKLTLMVKSGMDGQSAHSNYQQSPEGPDFDDSSLFCVAATMLRLIDSKGDTVWKNRVPNSPNWCRPIYIAFSKETTELSNLWKEKIYEQVRHLETFCIILYGRIFEITFKVYLTMLDGLMKTRLTDKPTFTNRCPFCGAKPIQRNEWDVYKGFCESKLEYLMFGISPLHLWIRCLEFILSSAFKLAVKVYKQSSATKQIIEETKENVKAAIYDELKIHVSKVKPGVGTTNDGNLARKFFKNHLKMHPATGINHDLLKSFYTLLTVIHSGFKLKTDTFKIYARDTFDLLQSEYKWYFIPPSVHAMLFHTVEVQELLPFTIGESSEEGLESSHKRRRYVRECHSRKDSREHTIIDMFHWDLQETDPVVLAKSSKAVFKQKREELTEDMMNLIQREIFQ